MPGAAAHASFSFLKALNGEPLADEYDPSKPNDFEDIMKQRERRKKEAEEEAERAARLREAEQVGFGHMAISSAVPARALVCVLPRCCAGLDGIMFCCMQFVTRDQDISFLLDRTSLGPAPLAALAG
jgi:hypothetical protein